MHSGLKAEGLGNSRLPSMAANFLAKWVIVFLDADIR
jgi:hypothetical protein